MIWTHLLICVVSDTSPIEHAINQAAVFLEDAAKVTNFTSTINMYLFTDSRTVLEIQYIFEP